MSTAETLITQNLDIWATAIKAKSSAGRGTSKKIELYGIKKLRELILELAVRGLLVPQDPKDEPASELLKKIAVEKAKLVKEGKIRKEKPLPSIRDEDRPYELPLGWEWERLGNIGNLFNGNSINESIKEQQYRNAVGRPFIATKDVGYGFQPLDYRNGIAIPQTESKFRVAHKGAVLICAEGGSAGKKCGIAEQDICFGNKLFACELFGDIESSFILSVYLTPSFFERFSGGMTGIIGGISTARFAELLAPVPPLKEQHRIVAKVDELMALCDKLEEGQENSISAHESLVEVLLAALTNASQKGEFETAWKRIAEHFDTLFTTEDSISQLKQTILQLAVMGKLVPQDPNDEPASELLKKIATEKAKLVKEGKIKKEKPLPPIKEEEKFFELPKGWEWVRLGNVIELISGQHIAADDYNTEGAGAPYVTGPSDFGNTHPVITKWTTKPKVFAANGDILITVKGSGIGKLSVVNISELVISRQLMAIRTSTISTGYMKRFLMTKFQFLQASQTGIAIPGIGRNEIEELVLNLPPRAEQNRIVAKVDELMALCDGLKEQIKKSQDIQLKVADSIAGQALAEGKKETKKTESAPKGSEKGRERADEKQVGMGI